MERKEYTTLSGNSVVIENGIISVGGGKLVIDRTKDGWYELTLSQLGARTRGGVKALPAAIIDQWAKGIDPVIVKKDNYIIVVEREVVTEFERQAKEIRLANAPETQIDGLAELRKAINAARYEAYRYNKEFDDMMEDEYNDGARPPKPVDKSLAVKANELKAKYPRAAAYLKAEKNADSDPATASGYGYRSAGKKAIKRLLDGEDVEVVLADMDAECKAALDKAMMLD